MTSIRHEPGRRGTQSRIDPAADSDTEVTVTVADGARPPLGIRVSTTARNAAERDHALRHLARTVKL